MHVGYDIGCSVRNIGGGKKKHYWRLKKTKFERIR
jgi:hypothetical protein